jgi:putative ABC transport system substrate-binding protein
MTAKMKRREFITLLGGATAWPLSVTAQQPTMPVVGFLSSLSASVTGKRVVSFGQGLTETGYVVGRDVMVEQRLADGQYDRLPALAADLVNRRVNLIAALAPPAAFAAKAATTTIPIVFIAALDPVKAGLVASLNRPGGNVTGLMTATSVLEAKKFGLLCEMVPNARLIAMLINPNYPPNAADAVEVQSAAQSIGRQLLLVRADSAGTIDLAIDGLVAQRAEALLVSGDPFLESRYQQLVALTTRHAIPAMFNFRESVQRGGLMSYGANISNNYRQLGAYAGRILKGESPADLPVMYPALFDFAINLVTAKALGLTVPPMLLARADEVIE